MHNDRFRNYCNKMQSNSVWRLQNGFICFSKLFDSVSFKYHFYGEQKLKLLHIYLLTLFSAYVVTCLLTLNIRSNTVFLFILIFLFFSFYNVDISFNF